FEEIVLEQIGVDQLDPGWKLGSRSVAGDCTHAVPASDQPRDECAAEYAGGARHEDGHRGACPSTRRARSTPVACRRSTPSSWVISRCSSAARTASTRPPVTARAIFHASSSEY